MDRFRGYACKVEDTQGWIIPSEVLAKAWEEYKKRGDFTIYLNFDKSKPVGTLIPEECSVTSEGLLVVGQIDDSKIKGFGINGQVLEKNAFELTAEITGLSKVKKLEIFDINAVEKPLKGYEAEKIG